MVVAQVQSDDRRRPSGAVLVPSGFLRRAGNCDSSDSHLLRSSAAEIAGRGTVPCHAATAQGIMTVDVMPCRHAAQMSCQNVFHRCQRIENARWRYRPIKVAPVVCKSRHCRSGHRRCIVDIMTRTAQLVQRNQMLQKRITELQRETDMFLKTVPARSPKAETESQSDEDVESIQYSESSSRSSSPVDITPPNSVESEICN